MCSEERVFGLNDSCCLYHMYTHRLLHYAVLPRAVYRRRCDEEQASSGYFGGHGLNAPGAEVWRLETGGLGREGGGQESG